MIQNALTEKELGQIEVVVERLGPFPRLYSLSTCGIANAQLLVEPPQDPLPHLGDRDREVSLYDFFELTDSGGLLVLRDLLTMQGLRVLGQAREEYAVQYQMLEGEIHL
jgi:hypothetical protein